MRRKMDSWSRVSSMCRTPEPWGLWRAGKTISDNLPTEGWIGPNSDPIVWRQLRDHSGRLGRGWRLEEPTPVRHAFFQT